jgi:hypothetical protein
MARLAAARPQPFSDRHFNLFHEGLVAVIGTKTIDLGINHNNYTVAVSVYGDTAALGAVGVSWKRGTRKGTFVISVNDAGVASVAAVQVSFIVIAGASVQ